MISSTTRWWMAGSLISLAELAAVRELPVLGLDEAGERQLGEWGVETDRERQLGNDLRLPNGKPERRQVVRFSFKTDDVSGKEHRFIVFNITVDRGTWGGADFRSWMLRLEVVSGVLFINADRKNAKDLFTTKENLLKSLLYGIAVFVCISPLAVYRPVDHRYAGPITGSNLTWRVVIWAFIGRYSNHSDPYDKPEYATHFGFYGFRMKDRWKLMIPCGGVSGWKAQTKKAGWPRYPVGSAGSGEILLLPGQPSFA